MEIKKYNRGTILCSKDIVINECFQIQIGQIEEQKEKRLIKIYQPQEYVLLKELFIHSISSSVFIVSQNTTGKWISKNEILNDSAFYLSILAKELQQFQLTIELIKIKDPLIKYTRYLYYKYQKDKNTNIYRTTTTLNFCQELQLPHESYLKAIAFLEHQKIIKRTNKLIQILDVNLLTHYAFLKEA